LEKVRKEVNETENEKKIELLSDEELKAVSGGAEVIVTAEVLIVKCVEESCEWESNPVGSCFMDQIFEAQNKHSQETGHNAFEIIRTSIRVD
jgi:hypothetical protein